MSFFKHTIKQLGLNPKNFFYSIKGLYPFVKNYLMFKNELLNNSEFTIKRLLPNLYDRFDQAGNLPLHYFYQDLIVAKKISKFSPEKHVDIGSRIDGFVAHVASFREIEVFDIRTIEQNIPSVRFVQSDLMSSDFELKEYCDSISCLHAIEHFGLGRYGDKINQNGHLIGLDNIFKLLKRNGRFYLSVPIGPQRIEFDAHRVFSLRYLLDVLLPKYDLISFSYVNDINQLFENVSLSDTDINSNLSCNYGCGIFELSKK